MNFIHKNTTISINHNSLYPIRLQANLENIYLSFGLRETIRTYLNLSNEFFYFKLIIENCFNLFLFNLQTLLLSNNQNNSRQLVKTQINHSLTVLCLELKR